MGKQGEGKQQQKKNTEEYFTYNHGKKLEKFIYARIL